MEDALKLAVIAGRNGEIPVGALVADPRGQIISRAANQVEILHDPTAHAEVLAIRQAARSLGNHRLLDCVLVTTLEPCAMCAGAMIHARLAGVVFGATDRMNGAIVSQAEFLTHPNAPIIWSLGGVLGQECARSLNEFFAVRRGRGKSLYF